MLPLRPDASGNYTKASFLTAGGIQSTIANPSPGNYVATALSRIDTMDLASATPRYSSRVTGSLNAPRWYGSGTLLPNGQVLTTSGSDRDEVMTPGLEIPVRLAELFDPASETWTQVATQNRARTYHNSAVLMRDGRLLIGGHAPITTMYMMPLNLGEPFSPDQGRDPSFEIYSPWYVFRSDRPAITGVGTKKLVNGGTFTATVPGVTTNLDSMVLMRRTAHTHLVDGDQHAVALRVLSLNPLTSSIKLAVPGTNVLPPGQYVLYANIKALDGKIVPSKGVAVSVGSAVVGACQ